MRWLYWASRSLTSVFLSARSALHSRRNRKPQAAMPGALRGLTLSAETRLRRHPNRSVGLQLDLIQHSGSVAAHRHGVLEVSAVRDGAHDLEVRGLGQRVAEAVDLAPNAEPLCQCRGLLGRCDTS